MESIIFIDIVAEKYCVSPPVEDLGDRLERLLPCCVPDLQFHGFVLDSYHKRAKLNSDSHFMLLLEFILSDSVEKTTLTNPCVSNDDQFEHSIMLSD